MLSAKVAQTGADVLVTTEIMRPASPWATKRAMRDVHGNIWPDADESARTAVAGVLTARADSKIPRVADQLRTRSIA
jgi:hypothetical protein